MKKMTKLFFSMAVASCALFATITANASAPVSLEYDEVNSTSKTAYVSLKTTDAEISAYEVYLAADKATIESFEVVASIAGFNQNITDSSMAGSALNDGVLNTGSGSNTGNGIVLDGGVIYTLKLTFAEDLTEDVTISWQDYSYIETEADWYDSDGYDVSCVAKANPNAGGKVEVNAKGQVYKTYADAPVFACVADSAVEVADITGKTLTWNIKVGDKVVGTTAANVGTVLSGEESSVVFGLMIINDNNTENFDTIDSAVLVIE